jgi:hypothetical protein
MVVPNMNKYKQVYYELNAFLFDIKNVDPKMFGLRMSFGTKMFGFEMMHRATLKQIKELEQVCRKESSEKKVLLDETGKARNESIVLFEAYLNAFYSLLQVIGKITSCFYQKEKAKLSAKMAKQFDENFGSLIDILKSHFNIDPVFSSYLKTSLGWYETLKNNRHMITHEGSAFLGFANDGKILFLDYPHPKKGFSWFDSNKSTKDLESYFGKNFEDLFNFLDFYVKHFRQWIK